MRALADEILGLSSVIDLVAVDGEGCTVLVLIGQAGEDMALVTRALAQRAWLAPRLRDWLKLAPDLGIRPEGPVRAILLAPNFQPEARAAVESIGAEALQLVTYRRTAGDRGCVLWLEDSASQPTPATTQSRPAQRKLPAFRSGLSEGDLSFSGDELREFDP